MASTSLCGSLVCLAFLGASQAIADAKPPQSDPAASTCQLKIEGKFVEKLVLVKPDQEVLEMACTGPILRLPPGQYRLQEVALRGGYRAYTWSALEFTLAPDSPYQLRAGAPLRPTIEVARQGRLLTMKYQLLDAAGRNYVGQDRTSPPRFAVCQDGREIASGAFEYG